MRVGFVVCLIMSFFLFLGGLLRVLGVCDLIERGGSTLAQGYAGIVAGIFTAFMSLAVFMQEVQDILTQHMINHALKTRNITELTTVLSKHAQRNNLWQPLNGGGWSYYRKLPEAIGTHHSGTALDHIRIMLSPSGGLWSMPCGPSVDMPGYQVDPGRWSGMIDLTEIVCETKENGDECGWDNQSYCTLAILVSQAIDIVNGHMPVADWKPCACPPAVDIDTEIQKSRAWIDIADVLGDSFNYAYVWTEVDRSGDAINPDGGGGVHLGSTGLRAMEI